MITTVASPIALRFVPDRLLWRVVLVAAGSLLIALCAQFSIPFPPSTVPITGQTFAVLLVGAALGSRLGAAAVLTYLGEGLLGLPFFAGGKFGMIALLGSSGGYLVGFVAAAFVVGFLAERGWDRRLWTSILAMLAGDAVVYLFGLPWLARFVPADKVIAFGLSPFIVGDVYKIVLAAALLPVAWRFVRPPR